MVTSDLLITICIERRKYTRVQDLSRCDATAISNQRQQSSDGSNWSNVKSDVPGFEAPEAFIFLYEKEKFLTLKEGKIEIWTSDGVLVTNFGGMELCSKVDLTSDKSEQNYIVSVSQSKRFLFAFQSLRK